MKKNKYFISDIFLIFIFFLFVYITLGLYITYAHPMVTKFGWDLIYSIDSGRNYWVLYLFHDFLTPSRHFLGNIFLCPLTSVINGLTGNPTLSAIILQSFAQSFAVLLLFNIIQNITKNKKLTVIFSLIFGLSNTVLLLTVLPEIYVWAGLTQLIFFSYFIKILEEKSDTIFLKNIILLSFFIVLSAGINTINITNIILIIILIIKKYGKNWKQLLQTLLKFTCIILLLFLLFANMQSKIYNNPQKSINGMKMCTQYTAKKLYDTIKGTYIEPFYALRSVPSIELYTGHDINNNELHIKRYLATKKQPIDRNFISIIFLLIPLCLYIKNKESKNKHIINTLIGIIVLYSFYNYCYWLNEDCSLFALNYFPLLIILLGLLYDNIKPNVKYIFLLIFLGYEAIININNLFQINVFLNYTGVKLINGWNYLIYSFLFIVVLTLLYIFITKLKNTVRLYIKDYYEFYTSIYISLIVIYGILHYGQYMLS